MKSPLMLIALTAVAAHADTLDTRGLRLNQLQIIGTHNSYKRPMQPELLAWLRTMSDDAEALDYSHPPLGEQLDLGVRSLELDLVHDPEGGRYAEPRGQELVARLGETPQPLDDPDAMRRPGFKVLHSPDFDFRSHHPTFEGALDALRDWSIANPDHLPIIVTMNLKDQADPIPGATKPAPFDKAALDALDQAIRDGLGDERLLTPDLVRGEAESLEHAVLNHGWPLVDEVRGRFLWVIDETDEKRRDYVEGHPSLSGRVCFTVSQPGEPEAAFFIINDPVKRGALIRRRVRAGYLVRTRADAMTAEARRGDLRRFEAAQRSDAQVITTDYPRADKRLGTGYRVRFAGDRFVRPHPITAAESSPR